MEYIKNLCLPSKIYLITCIIPYINYLIFKNNQKYMTIIPSPSIIIPSIIRILLMVYLINYICEKYGNATSWYLIIFLFLFLPVIISTIILKSYCDKYNKKCETIFKITKILLI